MINVHSENLQLMYACPDTITVCDLNASFSCFVSIMPAISFLQS